MTSSCMASRVLHARHSLAVLVLVFVCGDVLLAQPVSTTVGVTARVTGALSVVTQDDLAFGTLATPFRQRAVDFTDNGPLGRRGRFTIRGDANTELLMELTMPNALTAGAATLPLEAWGMRVHTVDADVGGTDTALMAGQNSVVIRLPAGGTDGTLFVRLRATAMPTRTQVPGQYGGTVRVSLTVTGS
jgi:hypothetical protein